MERFRHGREKFHTRLLTRRRITPGPARHQAAVVSSSMRVWRYVAVRSRVQKTENGFFGEQNWSIPYGPINETRGGWHTRGHSGAVFGPYQYVRNPMYSGILLVGASLGLALGTWLVPLAAAAMFSILARRTRTEEALLVARFGDQYRTYMKRVGRFFPRLRSRRDRAADPWLRG